MKKAAKLFAIAEISIAITVGFLVTSACNKANSDPENTQNIQKAPPVPRPTGDELTNYDLRRIRPSDNSLVETFERLRKTAIQEKKRVAVLFSADWCQPCQGLDLELGNRHPASAIGDVRILQLKEEEWEDATRLNEFNELRARWYPTLWSYPVFILLDDEGNKQEEMKEAIERLKSTQIEPTLPNWLLDTRTSTL